MGHLVVGATELEAKDGLCVLAFEQNGVANALGELRGIFQWCFDGNVIHFGSKNASEIIRGHVVPDLTCVLLRHYPTRAFKQRSVFWTVPFKTFLPGWRCQASACRRSLS